MESTRPENVQVAPGAFVSIGAVVTIASVFLQWFEVDTGPSPLGSPEYNASDFMVPLGLLLLIPAIALLVIGPLLFVRGTAGKGRGEAIAALVLALIVVVCAGVAVGRTASALAWFGSEQIKTDFGIDDDADVGAILREAEDRDTINVKPGSGAIAGFAAGALMLIGAALGVTRKRSEPAPDDGAPPPPPSE